MRIVGAGSMGEQDSGFPLNARHALSNLRPRREGPGVLTHHLGIWRQQAVAVVQSSRGHLLQHRLAAAAVVTDGGGGGDFAGALAVTHWQERETHTHTKSITNVWKSLSIFC